MPRDLMVYFRAEARELLQKLSADTLSFESDRTAELLTRLLRHAHTLKGAARVVEQKEMASAIHLFEEILDPYRKSPESFPVSDINRLLEILDGLSQMLARLEQPAPPAASDQPDRKGVAASASGGAQVARNADDGGLALLRYQGLEVDALLEDLRAAAGQVEVLRRNLQNVERGKTLGEFLLAQLSGEGVPKAARLVAEELQLQLRGVERGLAFAVDQMERELRQVQESTEKLRLVRAEVLFPILRRALRDAALENGISAELSVSGGELRLDAQLLAGVQSALVQAVRNSLAHGIEPPETRVSLGKAAQGTVTVDVTRQGRHVIFRCRDDGRGVDLHAVRRGLERKGVDVQGMDQEGLLAALMRGGLSTARTITQTAGRGIGLDLIRETAVSLNGEATLKTEPGVFTELSLRLPWTLAGMDFLEVVANAPGQEDAPTVLLPLDSVRSTLRLAPEEISRGVDGDTIVFEGQVLRLLSLNAVLQGVGTPDPTAVVLQCPQGPMALSVSAPRGTRVATLLPLPAQTVSSSFVAGAILDADGDAQLVLDPEGLYEEATRARPAASPASATRSAKLLVIDDSLTTRMLQQSILESAGFQVELACSAEEGLEKVREAPYGLILVDVEMPGVDGFTFVERIRSDPQLRHIPAILVTSRDSAEDKLRGQTVGAQGYMVKSEYDQKGLLRKIRSLLA